MDSMKNNNFWKNKNVLITGHTGFKGSWLTLLLYSFGAKVTGYAIDPISKPNFFDDLNLSKYLKKDFRENISNLEKLKKIIKKIKPSIIFHLVGQSSVLVSYKDPLDTINANVNGTVNLLEAARNCKSVKSMVLITSDKVYLNLEEKKKFKEADKLGGHDLYSSSKAACDILADSYIKSFYKDSKCNIGIARSGNCIGGGDWTKDRIVKDCVEAFIFNKKLVLRSPKATRPWQHVLEPLFGYLKLAEKLFIDKNKKFVGAWNFGPNLKENLTVLDLAKEGKKILNSRSKIQILKSPFYESSNLSIDSTKSKKNLNWKLVLNAKQSIRMTFEWYNCFYNNRKKIIEFTFNQVDSYKKSLKNFLVK
tara:strand:- start:3785 stop:4876 length:1092 start_codon:yes stop_codon:yes gene_type:complete